MRRATPRRGRGMTLIEVLIGFLILAFVTVSVLQMFSMALAVNMGSAARTDLTYRAERVAETIRTMYGIERTNTTLFNTMKTNSGVDLSTQVGQTVSVPPTGKEAFWDSWAKVAATNVPYAISYTVATGTNNARWVVTVTARPTTSGVARYPGMIGAGKAVNYAATIQ
jgi:Tfp pilus assembly protein PilV